MSVEKDLYSRLTGFAGLAALVGTRVYPVRADQNTAYPCITYTRITTQRISAMGEDIGDVRAVFQFDVWAKDPDGAQAVAEQVRLALQRYSGTNNVQIQDIYYQNETNFYEDDTEIFRVSADFEVCYIE